MMQATVLDTNSWNPQSVALPQNPSMESFDSRREKPLRLKLRLNQFRTQNVQTQAETRPNSRAADGIRQRERKRNRTHLLNLSHMMANSDIWGTSLSWTFCSWLLLRHLWNRRLAKDWSFPWAIFRQISCCVREMAHRQSKFSDWRPMSDTHFLYAAECIAMLG